MREIDEMARRYDCGVRPTAKTSLRAHHLNPPRRLRSHAARRRRLRDRAEGTYRRRGDRRSIVKARRGMPAQCLVGQHPGWSPTLREWPEVMGASWPGALTLIASAGHHRLEPRAEARGVRCRCAGNVIAGELRLTILRRPIRRALSRGATRGVAGAHLGVCLGGGRPKRHASPVVVMTGEMPCCCWRARSPPAAREYPGEVANQRPLRSVISKLPSKETPKPASASPRVSAGNVLRQSPAWPSYAIPASKCRARVVNRRRLKPMKRAHEARAAAISQLEPTGGKHQKYGRQSYARLNCW